MTFKTLPLAISDDVIKIAVRYVFHNFAVHPAPVIKEKNEYVDVWWILRCIDTVHVI